VADTSREEDQPGGTGHGAPQQVAARDPALGRDRSFVVMLAHLMSLAHVMRLAHDEVLLFVKKRRR